MRAPPELAEVHQLGKSPVLVASNGRTITESMAIASYLLKTYDTTSKFATADWIRDETLCSFAGTSIGNLMSIELLFDLAVKHTPWPFRFIMKMIKDSFDNFFSNTEFKKDMTYLQEELGDSDFFNGKEIGRCDIILSWPMDMILMRGYVNLAKDYPKLHAWKKRIEERPAWKSGLEKGSTYDVGSW
jgi:glutathione S-transferase